MKKCSYCGKEYPDDATACAIDGEPFAVPSVERTKVTGVWRGAYGYDGNGVLGAEVVPFTFTLKQGWLGHFGGVVTEDAPMGMPGVGRIDGYFGWPTIEFTKQMPVGYTARPDCSRMTLREYFTEHGHACEHELPSPPISYEGTFLDANRVQGLWVIKPIRVSSPDGWSITSPQTTGLWCAEFVAADTRVTPTDAPKQPFFDRSLLPEPEILAESNSVLRSLGKFAVADADTLLKRFEGKNIRFEIKRDDLAMRQMSPFTQVTGGYAGTAPMIEIFVNPDDETQAVEIMGEDKKV